MNLKYFKDLVGRDHKQEDGVPFKDWEHFKYMNVRKSVEIAQDRAAELYAKSKEDDGYKEGYTDAYEGIPNKFAVQKDYGDELPY
jgi:hypothetical protein